MALGRYFLFRLHNFFLSIHQADHRLLSQRVPLVYLSSQPGKGGLFLCDQTCLCVARRQVGSDVFMVWTWTTRDTFFSQHFIEDLIHTARKGHNGINRTHTGHLLLIGFLTLASPFLQRSSRLIFGQGHALTIGGGHNQFRVLPLGAELDPCGKVQPHPRP